MVKELLTACCSCKGKEKAQLPHNAEHKDPVVTNITIKYYLNMSSGL